MATYLPYARVSERGSDWHAKGIESTITQQIAEVTAWVRAHDPKGIVLPPVSDEFASAREGSLEARPGMSQILATLHSNQWDVLITVDWDRVVRSVSDGLELLRRVAAAGRGVVAIRQQWDYSNAIGRLMLVQHIAISEYMRASGAEKTKAKMVYIASQGGWPAGNVPLGYRRRAPHDNVLEVDPRGAELVRAAFQGYAAGDSAAEVGRRLGLKEKSLLNGVLRNPIYIGRIHYAGTTYEGRHQPIIAQDLWERVQERLPNTKSAPRPNSQAFPYLLSGLVRCHCGRAMRAYGAWGKRSHYPYYRCNNPAHRPAPTVRAEHLDEMVLRVLSTLRDDDRAVRAAVAEAQGRREHARLAATPELCQVRDAIRATDRDLAAIERAFLDGLVTAENAAHWNARMAAVNGELQRLRTRETELAGILEAGLDPYLTAEALASHVRHMAMALEREDPAQRAPLVRKLVLGVERQEDASYIVRTVFRTGCSANGTVWHPQGESNPCLRDENPLS